jgi:hypothetical protein
MARLMALEIASGERTEDTTELFVRGVVEGRPDPVRAL